MSNHGFTRCDGEFETIGEDLNMSTMGIVQQAKNHVMPDISRELALLGMVDNFNTTKEDKHMLPVGTKVIIRTCDDYHGRHCGRVGTVCRNYLKTKRIGVMFDGIKNPESKEGIFWFSEGSLMPYDKPVSTMSADDVKNVIFSGGKTIILWNDGTKTIATCGDGDSFDPYAGFCAAVTKKVFGTTSRAKRALEKNTKALPAKEG